MTAGSVGQEIPVSPSASLFALRPWVSLALPVGIVISFSDPVALPIILGLAVVFGLVDVAWTMVQIGCNRVIVTQDEIVWLSWPWRHEVGRFPISPRYPVAVTLETSGRLFEWFAPAFQSYAVMTLPGKELELLLKTDKQVEEFKSQLNVALCNRGSN
ncbi:hypothetical protein BJ980_002156 [Nocardioides daedukensis]|uniref:Uncharacterized protein n=1 Tax=Nocardioides daedukensis TaxID=634462 RepID=A0A7Y9UP50_9ACTN|nr:hypothetical protein [Nocardioides daedukensis]NYG59233.1 hypothetical protein [Nocardioides daedukensis]